VTQTSRPTGQHTDNYPNGDSGPYSSLQWRTVFKELFTTDDDQGPIGGYLNELEVTNPIGKTIRVATGGAVVGGNVFFNDANVDFSPPNPAGAARYDYVVACLNDTDTVMTVSDAGHTLAFPTDLTDYNSASSIQEYTCRLAIVRGAEGGGLPTLDQNDEHYMVPLASYLISTGGAVSSLTDQRYIGVFPSGGTRTLFVPACAGYNATDAADKPPEYIVSYYDCGVPLDANDLTYVGARFRVPDDFASDMTVEAYVAPQGAGDLYCSTLARCYECDVASGVIEDTGYGAVTVSGLYKECINPLSISDTVESKRLCSLTFTRDATNPLDTIGAGDEVHCLGFIVSYTAKM